MNTWIKCEEQLPEIEGEYLTLVRYKNYKGKMVTRHMILYFFDGFCGAADDVITHWQPLPAPPMSDE